MTPIQALLLGALQGLTEFLPISSSGHLVLAEKLLHIPMVDQNMQGLNILLHAGTLCALLLAYAQQWFTLLLAPFRRDVKNVRRLILLIVATLPGAVAGYLLEEWIAEYFQSLLYVGGAFAITGVILLLGECCDEKRQTIVHRILHPLATDAAMQTPRTAFFIGIAQALALVPGLSRSGLTISAGRAMGLSRKDALDFSFLMATPIIAGATVLSLTDFASGSLALPPQPVTILGIATSFVVSLLAIIFLRSFVVRRSFRIFAPYLFIVSAFTITLSLYT